MLVQLQLQKTYLSHLNYCCVFYIFCAEQHTDFDLVPDILKHFNDSLAELLEGEKVTKEQAETSNDSKKVLKLRKGKSLKELQQVFCFI